MQQEAKRGWIYVHQRKLSEARLSSTCEAAIESLSTLLAHCR
jgi:hypothetical protein